MLAFNHLTIADETSSNRTALVKDVSGYVRRSGMTVIVGASGSGKTLLMSALCGRLSSSGLHVAGNVTLDGRTRDLSDNHSHASGFGFVAQEDNLIGELTVRETLMISARMRVNASEEELKKEVDELIAGLGLQRVADNIVGTFLRRGLSGGEKRRLSAGVELAARPTCICLDE